MTIVLTRATKQAARYTDAGGRERCSACRFFMPQGTCGRIIGPVSPRGWCKYYSMEAVQRWQPQGAQGQGGSPTLDLSFTSGSGTLDPRITFTRGSTATYFDATGVMRTAATNLALWSEQFDQAAAWLPQGSIVIAPIVTANVVASPNATVTADRIVFPVVSGASASSILTYIAMSASSAAAPYTFSIWLRGNVGGEQLYIEGISPAAAFTSVLVTLTTAWQRFSVTIPTGTTGQWYFAYGVDLRDVTQSSRAAATVFAWGAQIETGSVATTYIPTTTAASGAPRFDYDPVTHALRGLLIEEARTNIALQSAAMTVAPWAGGSVTSPAPTVTANAATAPDGTTTATMLVCPVVSVAGSVSYQRQTITITAAVYTWSMYLRGAVGGEQTYLICADGANYYRQLVTLTTQWQRFTLVTGTLVGPSPNWSLGVDLRDVSQTTKPAQTIFAWGAQLEQGALTSYIPTTAAAVTRGGDVCQIPVDTWYNPNTLSLEVDYIPPASGGLVFAGIGDGNFNNSFYVGPNGVSRPTGGAGGSGVSVANVPNKICGTNTATQAGVSTNGSTPAQYAQSNCALPTATRLTIGCSPWGLDNQIDGCIRRVRYWPRVLSNAEMQQVTT